MWRASRRTAPTGAATRWGGHRRPPAARVRAAAVIGRNGSSERSVSAIAGDHSSSRRVSARRSRDLPCPALAQQHDVVPRDECALHLGEHRGLEPVEPRPRVSARRQSSEEVFAHLCAQRSLAVPGGSQLTQGADLRNLGSAHVLHASPGSRGSQRGLWRTRCSEGRRSAEPRPSRRPTPSRAVRPPPRLEWPILPM